MQEVANPECKDKKRLLAQLKRQLNKLYENFSKSKQVFHKDGSPRENCAHQHLKREIVQQEAKIDRQNQELKAVPEKIDMSLLEDYRLKVRNVRFQI